MTTTRLRSIKGRREENHGELVVPVHRFWFWVSLPVFISLSCNNREEHMLVSSVVPKSPRLQPGSGGFSFRSSKQRRILGKILRGLPGRMDGQTNQTES